MTLSVSLWPLKEPNLLNRSKQNFIFKYHRSILPIFISNQLPIYNYSKISEIQLLLFEIFFYTAVNKTMKWK